MTIFRNRAISLSTAIRMAAIAFIAWAAAVSVSLAQLATFSKSELTIETGKGAQHFTIEEAISPQQMMQGLMYRNSLLPDAGMLFEYKSPQGVSFWMKNTLIPLDMLFIAADGSIVDIHERAVPMSLDPITEEQPVIAVLELNGGTAERLGIKRGDHVHHPLFEKQN